MVRPRSEGRNSLLPRGCASHAASSSKWSLLSRSMTISHAFAGQSRRTKGLDKLRPKRLRLLRLIASGVSFSDGI